MDEFHQFNKKMRQIETLKKYYPNYDLITYIGSGMNLNRKGLRKIIDMAIMGKINEVVIVHRNRRHYNKIFKRKNNNNNK